MALQKQINTGYNVKAEYWKVRSVLINHLTLYSHVILDGYFDAESRDQMKIPLTTYDYTWEGSNFPFTIAEMNTVNKNPISIAYEKIKESKLNELNEETNVFADALDV